MRKTEKWTNIMQIQVNPVVGVVGCRGCLSRHKVRAYACWSRCRGSKTPMRARARESETNPSINLYQTLDVLIKHLAYKAFSTRLPRHPRQINVFAVYSCRGSFYQPTTPTTDSHTSLFFYFKSNDVVVKKRIGANPA
jgi:hypothetical protein